MATHSSVLAWRIPGTGDPGGLPSMGSHRVGHDWSDLAAAAVGSEMYFHNFCDSYRSFAHWKIIWHVLESFCTLQMMIFCFTHTLKENLTKFIYIWSYEREFPGGANGKEPSCQCRRHKSCGFNPWVGKIPGGSHASPPQYPCLENLHGQRSLAGYSP